MLEEVRQGKPGTCLCERLHSVEVLRRLRDCIRLELEWGNSYKLVVVMRVCGTSREQSLNTFFVLKALSKPGRQQRNITNASTVLRQLLRTQHNTTYYNTHQVIAGLVEQEDVGVGEGDFGKSDPALLPPAQRVHRLQRQLAPNAKAAQVRPAEEEYSNTDPTTSGLNRRMQAC